MNPTKIKIRRRRLLQAGATVFFAPALIPFSVLGSEAAKPPSERITVGIIGLGSRGFNLLDELLTDSEVQIVAVCDVDTFHYRDRPWGKGTAYGLVPARQKIDKHYGKPQGVSITKDFREVCQSEEVEAVVVATPDHWHALCTLEALRNGKDVYCEKPITHTFHEGQQIYREVATRNAVFQTGSQQRSDARFRRAVELVRNGHLGKMKRVEVGLPPGYDGPQGDVAVTATPKQLDYDAWCGPAPRLPYMQARHHRWWRGHRAFGGGVLMDWIGHHNDIAQWALGVDRSGPTEVEAIDWTWPETDVYNTPHHYEIRCKYQSGVESTILSRNTQGTRFIGEDGWVFVTRGQLTTSDPRWTDLEFSPGSERVSTSDNHMRNFLDCVRSRQACIAPAEAAHRSITPGHLAYVAQAVGRGINWEADKEEIIGDSDANALLQHHDYRDPWNLAAK